MGANASLNASANRSSYECDDECSDDDTPVHCNCLQSAPCQHQLDGSIPDGDVNGSSGAHCVKLRVSQATPQWHHGSELAYWHRVHVLFHVFAFLQIHLFSTC